MSRNQDRDWLTRLDAQVTRRAALRIAGVGGAALLARQGPHLVAAQDGTPAAASLATYPEVMITARDFQLELPASIPGGLTRLTLQNDGTLDHHAMFMRLNDGATMDELEAALTSPDLGPIFALSASVGGPEVGPGRSASVIADLPSGQYMVICIIPDEAGMPHYMMGMQTPVEVTAASETGSPPVPDTTIELVDFHFAMPALDLAPGQFVWEVANTGEQLHELIVQRQAPDVSFADVQAILGAPPGATPEAMAEDAAAAPPWVLIGGVAPMSPGSTNWAILDLEEADYFAICFIPDPASGAPHFMLGMIQPFSVG